MTNKDCLYCGGTGVRNNGYFNHDCPCTYDLTTHTIIPPKIIDGEVENEVEILKRQIKGRDIWTKVVEEENLKYRDLYNTVIKFMKDNDIGCEDTIHQCDWVIENAYDFITDLFNIVKADLGIEEDKQ